MVRKEIESIRAELKGFVDSRLSEVERPLHERVFQAVSGIDKKIDQAVEGEIKSLKRDTGSRFRRMDHRVGSIEFKNIKNEIAMWKYQKIPGNVFVTSIELLVVAIAMRDQYKISEALDALDSSVSGMEKASKRFDAFDLTSLEKALEKLGDDFQSVRTALLSRIQKLQT
jgi:hypothetical protein